MEKLAQFERLAQLCEDYPEAGIGYIASGEPVSILFLRRIEKTAPQFLDELFNTEFEVEADFNPDSLGEMYTSDHLRLYEFMKRFYGKRQAEDIVLSRPLLWQNFLRFACKGLFDDGRIVQEFRHLLEEKDYLTAYVLLESCSKKYCNKIRNSISNEQLLDFFVNLYKQDSACCDTEVFDVKDMVKKNIFSPEVLEVYFSDLHCFFDYPKAVKYIVRKGGLESLKAVNNYELKKLLEKM